MYLNPHIIPTTLLLFPHSPGFSDLPMALHGHGVGTYEQCVPVQYTHLPNGIENFPLKMFMAKNTIFIFNVFKNSFKDRIMYFFRICSQAVKYEKITRRQQFFKSTY